MCAVDRPLADPVCDRTIQSQRFARRLRDAARKAYGRVLQAEQILANTTDGNPQARVAAARRLAMAARLLGKASTAANRALLRKPALRECATRLLDANDRLLKGLAQRRNRVATLRRDLSACLAGG
jgi:hypothetical protein